MKVTGQKQIQEQREVERTYAGAPHDVSTAVAGPRTVYRATIAVSVAVPTPETSVVVDPSAAALVGTFGPRDSVLSGNAFAQLGGVVVVTVPEPREVRLVSFKSSVPFGGATVQLFRLDEDTVAPQPTATSQVVSSNAASFGTGDFADVRFAVGADGRDVTIGALGGVTVRGYPTGARLGLADPATPDEVTFFWPGPHDSGDDVNAGAELGAALQAFLGGRSGALHATLVIQSDQPCTFYLQRLDTGTTFALDGFGFPSLGPGDVLDTDALAARIAAAEDPVSAHLRAVLHGAPVVDGLNAAIGSDALYDATRFAGVQLSDATKAALGGAADLARTNRLLLQDAYPDAIAAPDVDRVLRFDGRSFATRQVAVSLPAGAHVTKATVATDGSLRADRGTGGAAPADGRSGVHVGADAATAIAATVAAATSVTGVAVDLLPLADGTKLAVELQEDWQGSPSGKKLAAGVVVLPEAGVSQRASVFFDPVVLPAGTVWVVLQASRGHAVWLATADESASVRVVRTPGAESVFPGISVSVELFTRSGAAAGAPATTLAVGAATVTPDDGGTYDIAAALTAAGGGAVTFGFSSAVGGTITVHPPHIEYSL